MILTTVQNSKYAHQPTASTPTKTASTPNINFCYFVTMKFSCIFTHSSGVQFAGQNSDGIQQMRDMRYDYNRTKQRDFLMGLCLKFGFPNKKIQLEVGSRRGPSFLYFLFTHLYLPPFLVIANFSYVSLFSYIYTLLRPFLVSWVSINQRAIRLLQHPTTSPLGPLFHLDWYIVTPHHQFTTIITTITTFTTIITTTTIATSTTTAPLFHLHWYTVFLRHHPHNHHTTIISHLHENKHFWSILLNRIEVFREISIELDWFCV